MVAHLAIDNGEQFIYADPENALYDDLDLNRGLASTFFSPAIPFKFRDKIFSGYDFDDLFQVLGKWKDAFYVPPKQEQAFNQGGTFIFDGNKTVFSHYDEATANSADIEKVIELAYKTAAMSVDANK